MSTHAIERGAPVSARLAAGAGRHLVWLVSGFAFAFLVPFVFADLLELPRDLDHLAGKIGAEHRAVEPNAASGLKCHQSRAASQVEHSLARCE